MPVVDKDLFKRLAAYCARGERSPLQVELWLERRGVEAPQYPAYQEQLQVLNLLNPERFAQAFASDKMRFCGWGPLKVRAALKHHKLPEELIARALQQQDEELQSESEAALAELLRSKLSRTSAPNPYLLAQKLIAYAANKGYTREQIARALHTIQLSPDELE